MKTWAKIIFLFDTSKQKWRFLFDVSKQKATCDGGTGTFIK
jgi:hypothetical protein